MNFCCLQIFFQNQLFKNSLCNTIRIPSSLNSDWAGLLLSLTWVQTVCKGYHDRQTCSVTSVNSVRIYGSWKKMHHRNVCNCFIVSHTFKEEIYIYPANPKYLILNMHRSRGGGGGGGWIHSPLSTEKTKNKKPTKKPVGVELEPLWQNFLDPRMLSK